MPDRQNVNEIITKFDDLSITDLLQKQNKEILIAIYIKTKQINGRVNWHDWFIKGIISTLGLGILTAVIISVINIGV